MMAKARDGTGPPSERAGGGGGGGGSGALAHVVSAGPGRAEGCGQRAGREPLARPGRREGRRRQQPGGAPRARHSGTRRAPARGSELRPGWSGRSVRPAGRGGGSWARSGRTRDSGPGLKQGRFWPDVRKTFVREACGGRAGAARSPWSGLGAGPAPRGGLETSLPA